MQWQATEVQGKAAAAESVSVTQSDGPLMD